MESERDGDSVDRRPPVRCLFRERERDYDDEKSLRAEQSEVREYLHLGLVFSWRRAA